MNGPGHGVAEGPPPGGACDLGLVNRSPKESKGQESLFQDSCLTPSLDGAGFGFSLSSSAA